MSFSMTKHNILTQVLTGKLYLVIKKDKPKWTRHLTIAEPGGVTRSTFTSRPKAYKVHKL